MDYLVENQNLWLLLNEDKISTLFYRQGTRSQIYNQERDVWMVCKLRQFCERFKPKRVVVIVGAAHVFGMKHLLDAGVIGSTRRPEDVLKDLLQLSHLHPPPILPATWIKSLLIIRFPKGKSF
jgi:pheromone shutdown protein TraB